MDIFDKRLLARMEDLADKAGKTGCACSKFLTPAEIEITSRAFNNRRDVNICFLGGFSEFERAIAVFTQPDWGMYEAEELIAGLELKFRQQDDVGHRDVLGAVLGLGLEREVLGDIFISPGLIQLVCIREMAGFIGENLNKAGRVGLKAALIPLDRLCEKNEELREKSATVASLRLDAIISAAFDISREKASELIKSGRVQYRHIECLNTSQAVDAGSIISVRGLGRVKLMETGGTSRKGRIWIKLGIFGG